MSHTVAPTENPSFGCSTAGYKFGFLSNSVKRGAVSSLSLSEIFSFAAVFICYCRIAVAVVLPQREVKCIAHRGVVHCFLTNEITAS